MSETWKTQFAEMARVRPVLSGERRSRCRVETCLPVNVRPSEGRYEPFEDVRTTLNVTSDSLYFTTWRQNYHPGMRLHVTFPCSPVPTALNVDYVGEVVRVEDLGDGSHGVAIRLLTILQAKDSDSSACLV